jgi:hypothetical protein
MVFRASGFDWLKNTAALVAKSTFFGGAAVAFFV